MPRTGWVKPAAPLRLTDHLSWTLLTRVFPPDLVDQAVADCGRLQQRTRLLPSRQVVYYVMGLAMFSQASYEEVMRTLIAGQSWSSGPTGVSGEPPPTDDAAVPTKAALFKARTRLGPEPLELLFGRVARPIASPTTPDSTYRTWRLMSLDAARLDVPDTPANAAAFARADRETAAAITLPQVHIVGLTELGTRTIVDAVVGGRAHRSRTLAADLVTNVPERSLLLAGAGFYSFRAWSGARATGAELLWRFPTDEPLTVGRQHDDGSYATDIGGLVARIIDVTDGPVPHRLITTIVDPELAPAAELEALYLRRWDMATAFEEIRAGHPGAGAVLRSKVPEGVQQEVFGHLCVHWAIRWLAYGDVAASK